MEYLPALPDDSIERLIAQAIDKSVPVETLERLLAMRKELKTEYAKEQFNIAMSAFQAECPVIKKTKAVHTKSGIVAYRYAPIDAIISQVRSFLFKHGLSYSIETATFDGMVSATCTVEHTLGHSHPSSITVPLGTKTDIMSATQVVAAALTFAKRYAFCNSFGILTGDDDNDARKDDYSAAKGITTKQINDIKVLVSKTKYTIEQFLKKGYNVASVEQLTSDQAETFIQKLEGYLEKGEGV